MKRFSDMTAREVIGLIIAGIGVALIPLGWYSSRLLWLVAVVLFIIGFLLLYTERVEAADKEWRNRSEVNPAPVREGVPGDIHNYSGWRDSGRSLGREDSGGGDD